MFAKEHKRTQIDMTRFNLIINDTGRTRKSERWLCDVVARVGNHPLTIGCTLSCCAIWADQHAIPAGFSNCLDDQFVKVFKHIFLLLFVAQQIGLDVWQDRLFTEVVANDGGDISVDGLIVGYPRANGISQCNISGAVRIQQAGYSQCRARFKGERIKVVIINTPVDDINAPQTSGRAHINNVIMHEQIAPLNQFDAHLACEEGMFKIRGIVDAWSEQHDYRFWPPSWGQREECAEQDSSIVVDGTDVVAAKQ